MPESLMGPTRDATVVLDVGGDVGALVLYTPPSMLGAEIEISPAGDPATRTHTAVRERLLPGRASLYAAVYPALTAGDHTLWQSSDHPAGTVTVDGGRVTEVDWEALVGADHDHEHDHDHPHDHEHAHGLEEALR